MNTHESAPHFDSTRLAHITNSFDTRVARSVDRCRERLAVHHDAHAPSPVAQCRRRRFSGGVSSMRRAFGLRFNGALVSQHYVIPHPYKRKTIKKLQHYEARK